MAIHKLILVVGQMRSGTAAVAGTLHHLGVPVAVSIMAPVPPHFRPDWEESTLSAHLVQAVGIGGTGIDPADAALFRAMYPDYLRHRLAVAGNLAERFGLPTVAIADKCPLLAFVLDEAVEAARSAALEPVVVTVSRDPEAVERSVRRAFGADADKAMATNAAIEAALAPWRPGSVEVSYEKLIGDTDSVAWKLANCAGVTDRSLLAAAVDFVKEPVSCQP